MESTFDPKETKKEALSVSKRQAFNNPHESRQTAEKEKTAAKSKVKSTQETREKD